MAGSARYPRGAQRCEVKLDAGGGDAFLLAGQQAQRAGISRRGAVQGQGARPQPGLADGGDFGRVYQRLADQVEQGERAGHGGEAAVDGPDAVSARFIVSSPRVG